MDFKGPALTAKLQPARPSLSGPVTANLPLTSWEEVSLHSATQPNIRATCPSPRGSQMCNDNCICRAAWIVGPDALKSLLAVLWAVAHPLTNERTRSLAEREGEDVSPPPGSHPRPGFRTCLFSYPGGRGCGLRVRNQAGGGRAK